MSSLAARRKNIDLIWGADELDGMFDHVATEEAAAVGSRDLLCALAEYFIAHRPLTAAEKKHWIGVINEQP
ncbi:MAG: hypothetical protein V4657_09295 [Pseudomonadota bacterium]